MGCRALTGVLHKFKDHHLSEGIGNTTRHDI